MKRFGNQCITCPVRPRGRSLSSKRVLAQVKCALRRVSRHTPCVFKTACKTKNSSTPVRNVSNTCNILHLPFWKHCICVIQSLGPMFKPADPLRRFTPKLVGIIPCHGKRVLVRVFWRKSTNMFTKSVWRIKQRSAPMPNVCLYFRQIKRSGHTCAWLP